MGPGAVVGIVIGWLAGSVMAAVTLAAAFRRLGAGDDRVVPVREQAGATAPAPTTAHSIDVAAVVAHALLGSMSVVADVARGLPAGAHDLLDGHAVTSRRATSHSEMAAATAT